MDVSTIMTLRPVSVGPDDTVGHVFRLMEEQDIRHVPVVEEGAVLGVLSDRDLLSRLGWHGVPDMPQPAADPTAQPARELMKGDVTTVSPDDSVVTAAVEFTCGGIGCLPVLDDGHLVGIVTEMDMAMAYWGACRAGLLDGDIDPLVEKSMTAEPHSVGPDTTLAEACALVRQHHVRHLPVVDGERLVGVVSDRDLRASQASDPEGDTRVATIMTTYPVVIHEDEHLGRAAERMVRHRISCLPVVRGRQLVGILSLRDVLDHCIDCLREAEPNITRS